MAGTQSIGKYQILEELGRGGFATVYKARDTDLGRIVALKVLHAYWAGEQDFAHRFHNEARAAANLRHPNIVTVYEAGEAAAVAFKVVYRPFDFKKNDGFKNSIVLSRELGLYRQDYCGCRLSRDERTLRHQVKAAEGGEEECLKNIITPTLHHSSSLTSPPTTSHLPLGRC